MSAVETSGVEAGTTAVSTGTPGSTDVTRAATAGSSSPRRRRRYLHAPVPWRRTDVTRAAVLTVLGAALGTWAWVGVSGEVTLRDQQGWIVLACVGAAVAACGGVYLVTVAMRAVRLGQRQLMFDLAEVMGWSVTVTRRGRLQLHSGTEPVETEADTADGARVIGPGMTIVHRRECPIARNKPVREISPADAAAQGFGTCGVCRS